MMYTGRRNTGEPRLQRDGVTFEGAVDAVASAACGDVQKMFGQHLRLGPKIPSCLRIEDQNGCGGVLSKLIWTGVVLRSQSLKSPARQFPIYSVGATPSPLAAMQAFVLADVDAFGDLAGPNGEAALGKTWAKADYPFAWLRACPDLRFACCQRHQPMVDARCHSGIVL